MTSSRRNDRILISLVTLGLLLPFIGKAFHIDDPIFIWTAEQVSVDPFDFFGFDVNWYGITEPMWGVNKNPPLVSYYIAAVAAIGGWSEASLHLGMILPALALALGIYQLALHLCRDAALAALVALATPVFLVSATSVMSDISMLALWVWSLAFFERGLERERRREFVLAGVLAGLCVLTKYFGLALIPLMFVYGGLRVRRAGAWLWSLGVAAVIVIAFDLYTRSLYGFDPLLDVMGYASNPDIVHVISPLASAAVGLFFLGGCMLGSVLWLPLAWSRRELAVIAPLLAGLAFAVAYAFARGSWGADIESQQVLFAAVGLHVLALAAMDVFARRDAGSLLLLLQVLGVFVFAAFTNWTTNGRSILPVIPAVGILVARAVERHGSLRVGFAAPILVAGFALAVVVAIADAQFADSARVAARTLSKTAAGESSDLYFQGSWGFQRYMEMAGVEKLTIGESRLEAGDRIVMAGTNSNVYRLPQDRSRLIDIQELPQSSWIGIMSRKRSAGFYASVWGALPFSFGDPGPERYGVYVMMREWAPEPLHRSQQPSPKVGGTDGVNEQ